jgi:hypothetical protein
VAKLRGTKLRTLSRSGEGAKVLPSRARAHKPPAKAISARKAAGKKVGGGKIPPKIREHLEKDPLPTRLHPVDPREKMLSQTTRYGKREPKARRHDEAAETRNARADSKR